jgi:hypothetical protein
MLFPEIPTETILRIAYVFTYVKVVTGTNGEKAKYAQIRSAMGDTISDQEFRVAFEFLYNLEVIRAEKWALGEFEEITPGKWDIEAVEVVPNYESEYLVEKRGAGEPEKVEEMEEAEETENTSSMQDRQ